ncbi:MAG: hypothetical protein PWQ29_1103 [Verrucomicrobiota bacterium]|jgi:hypothetical protein|nr:hypothetical protein [Verrucomicrobiota bacterium]MDK2963709.1 hypothetical protein [Verrucomicrobiota bacterium]
MNIRLHPHAKDRLTERGATENEGLIAVREGERYGTVYGIDRLDANEQLQSEAGGHLVTVGKIGIPQKEEQMAVHEEPGEYQTN